jgi:tol-pal system protein YbgF
MAMPGEKEAYNNAYSLVTSKRFQAALDAFKKFMVDYPDGHYAPNALYWMGELYQVVKPQDLEAARQAFTQLLERYPDNSKAPDAMYKLGKVYFQKGNQAQAKEWFNRVIAQYSNSVSSAAAKSRQFLQDNY